jgi:hypothetical protein
MNLVSAAVGVVVVVAQGRCPGGLGWCPCWRGRCLGISWLGLLLVGRRFRWHRSLMDTINNCPANAEGEDDSKSLSRPRIPKEINTCGG